MDQLGLSPYSWWQFTAGGGRTDSWCDVQSGHPLLVYASLTTDVLQELSPNAAEDMQEQNENVCVSPSSFNTSAVGEIFTDFVDLDFDTSDYEPLSRFKMQVFQD